MSVISKAISIAAIGCGAVRDASTAGSIAAGNSTAPASILVLAYNGAVVPMLPLTMTVWSRHAYS
jgi:hypothetical protein